MKITINKGAKRVLSLVLAVAILIGTLFTANIGVNINADAAVTETNSDVWDGKLTKPTEQDNSGTYIIRTAEEFAWVALSSQHTTEANYKVADGIKYFNMNGKKGITFNSTAADVEAAELTGTNWANGETNNPNFKGTIDGNGVIIFNIYATGAYAALFPYIINAGVNDSPRATATLKNINVTSSYFTAYHAVGGIVGFDPGYPTSLTIDGCSVTNSCLINYGMSDLTKSVIGGIAGDVDHNKTIINNCFVGGNKMVADKIVSGFVGNSTNNASVTISNSICIDALPYATKVATTEPNTRVTTGATYTNVYTNSNFDSATYTTIKNVVSGQDAVNQMTLDFSGTWFANTTTYPTPRALHSFNVTNNGNGTHSEVCADCGLVGVPATHYYNEIDKVYNQSVCACGARIDGIFDIWDSEGATADSYAGGSGTEADPYIIETVEQLFKMVCEAGEDADGNPQYYKVADGVNALYINDTRSMSQADFEAAAAADTLYNWSEKIPTGFCASCTHTKPATITLFNGYFDGNGASIYGLYSKTTSTNSWVNGTGFVPGMVRNSVIKNVIFDTSYVKSSAESAAVVCSSFGLSKAASHVKAGYCCSDFEEMLIDKATPSLINIAVRNAYVESKSSMPDLDITGDGESDNVYSYSAGITANYATPKSLKIQYCLFDGTNSKLVSDTGSGTTAATLITSGGIFASAAEWVYTDVNSCISIGADVSNKAGNIDAQNSYTTVSSATSGAFIATGYKTVSDFPFLNWTAWDIDAVATYGTPMPKLVDGWEYKDYRYYKDAYKNSEWYDNLPKGQDAGAKQVGYEQGVFSRYDALMGAGTPTDPYIIDNVQLLFEIIASGGSHRGIPQYYKLACDIDLDGIQWVNYSTDDDYLAGFDVSYYKYKPFAGTIDGDGHTITGMFTGVTDANAGFIPELTATGAVKNLHFRNCYAYTSGGNYGIIAGTAASGAKIEGCSIEGGVADKFVGAGSATITDSYCGSIVTVPNDKLFDGTNYDTAVWYKGGAEGDTYKLLNKALAMPCADIDGDGEGYEYNGNDLSALKNKLLRQSAYANIYGDVSRNGKTDIRDMVILQREVAGDDIDVLDGFWKNAKAGNISIFYDENDNYDAARKLELYLEEATGVDVGKNIGAGDGVLDIIVKNDANLGANNYSVAYVLETGVLTISGGSFTSVEEGVIKFINGSDVNIGKVFTGSGAINSNKAAINVQTFETSNDNGSTSNSSSKIDHGTYYYVWGDEFDSSVNGTVSYDKWLVRDKGNGSKNSDDYKNLYLANAADLPKLNVVSDGKLTMHRGVGSLAPTSGTLSGSVTSDGDAITFGSNNMSSSGILTSRNSLLFKRGYLEMRATLPNDNYAFPAWWLLTSAGNSNLEIASTLYSKVYEVNDDYYETSPLYFSSDDYRTYKYKLPTSTFEIDLFEIINNGSKQNTIFYNVHKWYTNAMTVKTEENKNFSVYELDWDGIAKGTISNFSKKLLTATYNKSSDTYSISNAAIKYHTDNAKSGQINVAINEKGDSDTLSGTKYGKADEYDFWTGNKDYDINMITKISSNSTVTEYKYGFLWTEDEMTFIIKNTNDVLVSSVTVLCEDLGYDKGSIMAEQYAYFLIDNHYYTGSGATISDAPMTIDYVRLYQLDGERDIVTPETEAFNSNNRLGK